MVTLLSIRGYGRWRAENGLPGRSHSAVRRAIADGRLAASLVDQSAGGFKIDPAAADQEWARNTTATVTQDPAPEPEPEGQGALFPGAEPRVAPVTDQDRAGVIPLARSQQVKALFSARLTQLDYEERSGKLCSTADVAAESFTQGRAVRDLLLLLPNRLSHGLAAETDAVAIEEILTREITEALEVLSASRPVA